MKKKKDVLIVARPDQSIQIYNALCAQNELTFDFVCFKVVPSWIKAIFPFKKFIPVSRHAHISYYTTIVNLLMYKWDFKFARNLSELNILERKVQRLLKKNDYRIIHHWPTYDYKCIDRYRKENPDVITLAEAYMPCPSVVYEEMKPVYEKYGLDITNSPLARFSSQTLEIMKREPVLNVPSEYVAESYRQVFPEKKYIIVPYGIFTSKAYVRRERCQVTQFVYAGTVSIEKGCDILFDCFKGMPELSLHVFGKMPTEQERIFEKYRKYNNINFHGQVPKQDLMDQLKSFDCGIHLSRFDAYSLAVGEMIGSGLPVIVSNKTGNGDDIKEWGFGYVVGLDQGSVQEGIRLMRVQEHYKGFIDNISHFISSEHTPYGPRMVQHYSHLIKTKRSY